MDRIPLKGGLEEDALTGWRKVLNWKAGMRKLAKKSYARRKRRQERLLARSLSRKDWPDNIDLEQYRQE